MPTVNVEPELYRQVERVAQEHKTSVNELFVDALRQYLWEQDRRKISQETAVYQRRYPELKSQYLGQYIAMRNGQVVDHDGDFQTLLQRVRQRFGNTPVMIRLVEDQPEQPLTRLGFRMETSTK